MESTACFVSSMNVGLWTSTGFKFAAKNPIWPQRSYRARSRQARLELMRARIRENDEGFVNCDRCGADVPVALSAFSKAIEVAVKCTECGQRWSTTVDQVMTLDDSANLVPATSKKSADGKQVVGITPGVKLFVGGLSPKVTRDALLSTFGEFGEVSDAAIICDRVTGRSRGFAFVTMENSSAAEAAMADLNDSSKLGGWRLSVRPAQEK